MLGIPNVPSDLGVGFEAFSKGWRPNQVDVLERLLNSDRKFMVLDAPTGNGKTLISAAFHRLSGMYGTVYSCTTKALQDQCHADFSFSEILKGRANYPCPLLGKGNTAADCIEAQNRCDLACNEICFGKGCPRGVVDTCTRCHLTEQCPYRLQKKKALGAEMAVLNSSLLLAELNFVGKFSGRSLLVIDEADTLDEKIANFATLEITQGFIDRFELPDLGEGSSVSDIINWLNESVLMLTERIKDATEWSKETAKALSKLITTQTCINKDWIVGQVGGTVTVSPRYINNLVDKFIYSHFDRILLMSATICGFDAFMRYMGVNPSDAECMSTGSNIPVENRMNYYSPQYKMNSKARMGNLPKMAEVIKRRMDNKKTIIHVTSISDAEAMVNYFPNGAVFSSGRSWAIEAFKNGEVNPLISPSLDRGFDFPNGECDIIIIAVVPFGNRGDARTEALLQGDKDWYKWCTARRIVQESGRAARSPEDFSKCYILDVNFGMLWQLGKHLFPEWWKDAFKKL